tara:strand:+ start:744 stop:1574 length:831 start_codon:yes stop_codon:yes gene_type:complete
MAKFILKSPIKFIQGTGFTITPNNTEIQLTDAVSVTFAIGQEIDTTSDVIFGSVSSSVLSIDSNLPKIETGSIGGLSSIVSHLSMSNDLNVNQDMTILGSITAQKFISELTESITIFESGSTRFGDTIDDRHSLTGSLNLTGSFNINNYSITEVSNDTTLADGSSTAVLTENALKTYLSTETEDFQTYLRKSFAHTGSFINSSTQSFSAVTASAPSGFSSTSKEDFMFFNNGAFMETDAISIKQSGSLMFLFVNTDSIGYDVDSNDEIVAFGKFNS